MLALFEDYPITESLLLWYPTFILAAELTLNFHVIKDDDGDCIGLQSAVVWVTTSFFLTLANLETWHFMIMYALLYPHSTHVNNNYEGP